jgi:hypothetical protein
MEITMRQPGMAQRFRPTIIAALFGVLGTTAWLGTGAGADGARRSRPTVDEPASSAAAEVAV